MMNVLKPCPFCGSKEITVKVIPNEYEGDLACVKCETCFATGPESFEDNSAIIDWNDRADIKAQEGDK